MGGWNKWDFICFYLNWLLIDGECDWEFSSDISSGFNVRGGRNFHVLSATATLATLATPAVDADFGQTQRCRILLTGSDFSTIFILIWSQVLLLVDTHWFEYRLICISNRHEKLNCLTNRKEGKMGASQPSPLLPPPPPKESCMEHHRRSISILMKWRDLDRC